VYSKCWEERRGARCTVRDWSIVFLDEEATATSWSYLARSYLSGEKVKWLVKTSSRSNVVGYNSREIEGGCVDLPHIPLRMISSLLCVCDIMRSTE
jgi:hypothetical protein